MFAVIDMGSKQYKVFDDTKLLCEHISANVGTFVKAKAILVAGTETGNSTDTNTNETNENNNNGNWSDSIHSIGKVDDNATVELEVIRHLRGRKIIVFKKRRRKNFRRRNGHRQMLTLLRVRKITV